MSAVSGCAWNASGSVMARIDALSVHMRWPIWCPIVQPSAGVGTDQSSAADDELVELPRLGVEIGQQFRDHSCSSSIRAQ